MKTRTFFATSGTVAAMLLATASAYSQPIDPPSWWGSTDGQTSSFCWQFSTPSFPPNPDFAVDPFGPPQWDRSGDVQWNPGDPTHQGFYCVQPGGSGTITVVLPNRRQIDFVKHVWLQVDFFEDASVGSDVSLGLDTDAGSTIDNVTEDVDDIGGGWFRSTVTLDIRPQPSFEAFTFFLEGGQIGAYIDNLYIGTHCEPVPEPATLAGLALGIAALATRRRRR